MRAVKNNTACSLWGSWGIRRPLLGIMAHLGKPIAKQSEGMAVEKYLSAGWAREKDCAQWKINQPPSLRDNKRVGTGSPLVCKHCSALYRGRFQVPSATGDDAHSWDESGHPHEEKTSKLGWSNTSPFHFHGRRQDQ